ncbi:hypothetical protein P7L78_14695 [Tistrella bauzanensis]|jgi:hypothetical protein|uniref:Uncharacterized protein n=1 Tax=Tistrella arctica TaxID=3133430 RepID=A0ABU9YF88_9PROT
MSTDLSRMSKDQLASVLDEAEAQIAEIRAELAHRQQAEQHQAIDALEMPPMRTGVHWDEVKAFFQQVLDELRSGSTPK